jgi:DNA polymerase III delta prime subunit
MDKLWVNKYRPINLTEVIGHDENILKIKDWINNLNINKNQALIISGIHGIGKSLTIKFIFEELNYLIKIIYPNEIKDHRIFDDFNDYYNHNNSIYSKINFKNINKKKLVLIFEETENITLTSEKKYIMDIFKENNKKKYFPLIFISNNQHSKLLNDLKKHCTEINFKPPTKCNFQSLIKNICIKENIIINNLDSLNLLIEFSQKDVRRLINLLQEYSYNYKEINNDNILNFINKSREKDIDIGLFDATYKILNQYIESDIILKLYENEKVLLPLMIQENYIKKVLNKCTENWNDILYNLVKISDSISRGDNIETSIYTDQNWYLQNIHGFYTCLNTSYWINKNNKNNLLDLDKIKFSSDLNKTSLKNINKKNINNLSKIIPNKSIYELLFLNRICNNLLLNNKEIEIINLLNSYYKDISIKEIELCLKIDKTFDFKLLCSKEKKNMLKLIKVSNQV